MQPVQEQGDLEGGKVSPAGAVTVALAGIGVSGKL